MKRQLIANIGVSLFPSVISLCIVIFVSPLKAHTTQTEHKQTLHQGIYQRKKRKIGFIKNIKKHLTAVLRIFFVLQIGKPCICYFIQKSKKIEICEKKLNKLRSSTS